MSFKLEKINYIIFVVGARPNFIKMAPILRAMKIYSRFIVPILVHTGQHYDKSMNNQIFSDLNLPTPDINLNVGSGTHADQTAEIMKGFEPVIDKYNPACVVVVGDVNSTLACALVASKKNIKVAHIEAGLRSFDRSMPEEINRVLTDQISDRLYTTERSAEVNLLRESIPAHKIYFSGNVMIDSVLHSKSFIRDAGEILEGYGATVASLYKAEGYGLVTLHRPSNVDNPDVFKKLLECIVEVAKLLPLIVVLHPRTRSSLSKFGFSEILDISRITILPPQGYFDMLGLMSGAKVAMTDSGGIQEETTALGVPCLTLRDTTERPITIEQGTNTLVGIEGEAILNEIKAILHGNIKQGRMPEMWDGQAAVRIAADLTQWLFPSSLSSLLSKVDLK